MCSHRRTDATHRLSSCHLASIRFELVCPANECDVLSREVAPCPALCASVSKLACTSANPRSGTEAGTGTHFQKMMRALVISLCRTDKSAVAQSNSDVAVLSLLRI